MQINDLDSGLYHTVPTWFETFLVWYSSHYILGTLLLIFVYAVLALPFNMIVKMRENKKDNEEDK